MQSASEETNRFRRHLKQGFSLVELLIVLALLAVCLVMLFPAASVWNRRDSEQRIVGAVRRSLLAARESAIRTCREVTWKADVLTVGATATVGFRINSSPRPEIVFHADGTADSDYRFELLNSQEQLIEALVLVGATGSVQVARANDHDFVAAAMDGAR